MKVCYISKLAQNIHEPFKADTSSGCLTLHGEHSDNIVCLGLNSLINFMKDTDLPDSPILRVVYRNIKRLSRRD